MASSYTKSCRTDRGTPIVLPQHRQYRICGDVLNKADAGEYMKLIRKFRVSKDVIKLYGGVPDDKWRNSFLYDIGDAESYVHDDIDRRFIQSTSGFRCLELYGLHTRIEKDMIFHGDPEEIVNLIATVIPLDDLKGIERLYTSNVPFPSDRKSDYHERVFSRHQGLTTVYVVNKTSTSELTISNADLPLATTSKVEPNPETKKPHVRVNLSPDNFLDDIYEPDSHPTTHQPNPTDEVD